ncbi:acetolactate synthase large subunit, partial [Acinetobacter baumannii]
KDVQINQGSYTPPGDVRHKTYRPRVDGDDRQIAEAVRLLAHAKRPIFYTGGGIINSGPRAVAALREFARITGVPVTSTLMGLGAFPA